MLSCGEDTICAPATPPGTGGVGVLRVSGPEAFQVADRFWFKPGQRVITKVIRSIVRP